MFIPLCFLLHKKNENGHNIDSQKRHNQNLRSTSSELILRSGELSFELKNL